MEYIERRIGRAQKKYSRVAQHYRVEVGADEAGVRAQSICWSFEPVDGTMATHPGVYCLRSNILDLEPETMWRTYVTLTEAESVFRSLKSELGLRPVYHKKQFRADGHLFISVLAYQAVCVLRSRIKAAGCHDSWSTVLNELCSITRTTTSFKRRDGRTLFMRKTAGADGDHMAVFKAMGIGAPPRNIQKTVV